MTAPVAQTLNYDQQLILATYKRIFKFPYNTAETINEKITYTHIQSQQIGYFLSTIHLLTDYCFNWNTYGPFSSKFESLLFDLDSKPELTGTFSRENSKALLCALLPDCLLEPLNTLCDSMTNFVYTGGKNQPNTLELPGSLLYIAESSIWGPKFEPCNEELKKRKKIFNDDSKNTLAWNCLIDANLLEF